MRKFTWGALRADGLALSAVANFTVSYAVTKVALAEWHPLAFMGTRFAVMAAIALGVLGIQRRFGVVFGTDLPRFALAGLFGFTLYQLGFVLGLDRTSAFSSTLLLTTIPLCSLLFLRIGGVEPVAPAQWGGVGLAVAGITVLIWAEEAGPRLAEARLGDLLSLGAAASFALYGIVGKPLGARYPASTVLAGTLLLGSLPLLPLSLVAAPARFGSAISTGGWGDLGVLGCRARVSRLHVVERGHRRAGRGGHRALHAAGPDLRRAPRGRMAGRAPHRGEARRGRPDAGGPGARARVGPGGQAGAESMSRRASSPRPC
jgi:drug/metabolite transporter (DMT)-like permease